MQGNNLILQNVTLDDLKRIVEEVFQANKLSTPVHTEEQDEYLTKKELCDFLKISSTTVWELTKKGKLKTYPVGGSVRYKRSEVERSIKKGIL